MIDTKGQIEFTDSKIHSHIIELDIRRLISSIYLIIITDTDGNVAIEKFIKS